VKEWTKKTITKDIWAIGVAFIAMILSSAGIVYRQNRDTKIFQSKIAQIEQDIVGIRKIIPASSGDRWTGMMMKAYNRELLMYIGDPITNSPPDIDTIRVTVPIGLSL